MGGPDIVTSVRPSWDEYFLDMARLVSTRATCLRAKHGAVIVRDHRVLSTGFNGAESGAPHCLDVGCEVVEGHCRRGPHDLENAIISAARYGISLDGAVAYLTSMPCKHCARRAVNAGITTVIYDSVYGQQEAIRGLLYIRLSRVPLPSSRLPEVPERTQPSVEVAGSEGSEQVSVGRCWICRYWEHGTGYMGPEDA